MNARTISLLAVVMLGAGGCSGSQGAPQTPDTPRSELPAGLTGEWFTGTLSSIQYFDRTTGTFQNPNGEGFYFIFRAGGDYETGAVIESTVGNCTMRLLGNETGTVTADGATLALHRHWVKTRVLNTCGADDTATHGEETRVLRFSIERDETGREWLALVHDDGSVERYRRWEARE